MHTYTWNKLAKNSSILKPASRGKNYPYVKKFQKELILPFVGTKSVLVKLKAWGLTEKNIHNVVMLFNNCEILEGEHPELNLKVYFRIDYQGKVYYVKKFDALKNPLTNRCSCSDYYFTAAWYNAKNGHCLYGPLPRPYKRKTKTRPPRNPRGIPLICKHLYHAWEYLRNEGLTLN